MVEALHRMNDVRSASNYERIIELATEKGVVERILADGDDPPLEELIMRTYLYARKEVFESLWDEEFLHSTTFSYDRVADRPRHVHVTSLNLTAFQDAVRTMRRKTHCGHICNVRHYEDEDGDYFLIRHSRLPIRETIERPDTKKEDVIAFRPVRQDVLHYNSETGGFRMKTAERKRENQDRLRDLFARYILDKSDAFLHEHAHDLYTLAPIQRDGVNFQFSEGLFDGDSVRVVEVLVATGEGPKRVKTMVANKEDVLPVVREKYPAIDLTEADLLCVRLQFRLHRERLVKRQVEIRPPCTCKFNTSSFADTIWDLLKRNGFLTDRREDGLFAPVSVHAAGA